MPRITIFALLLGLFLSSCETAINCVPVPECGATYTFKNAGFCPNGYLFTSESGEKIFVDYFAYAPENIEQSHFQELKKGDQVSMSFDVIDQSDWLYHLIDYICEPGTKSVPEVDKWVMVTCLSTTMMEPGFPE